MENQLELIQELFGQGPLEHLPAAQLVIAKKNHTKQLLIIGGVALVAGVAVGVYLHYRYVESTNRNKFVLNDSDHDSKTQTSSSTVNQYPTFSVRPADGLIHKSRKKSAFAPTMEEYIEGV